LGSGCAFDSKEPRDRDHEQETIKARINRKLDGHV
jgi:hypothetical protein